jgi:hypothetical protein
MALAGTFVDRLVWPLNVRAQGRTNPRGTARQVIFLEMGGGISPMDCWDFKETKWTPKDLDVQKLSNELYLSKTLFPRMSSHMDKVALVRSMRASELVHFQGQYHTQSGRSLNIAVAKEIPAFGTVVAHELEPERRESDSFPTYVSTNLNRGRVGALGSGFFPARFTGLDLDPMTVFDLFGSDSGGANQVLEDRWRYLKELGKISAATESSLGDKGSDYRAYYEDAYGLLQDSRWSDVFNASDEDRERYGDDDFGRGMILTRNLLAADAGTRFVYLHDGDRWDHHSYIFTHEEYPANHYFTCNRWDKGFASLLEDLSSMPGHEIGKTMLDETLIVSASEFGRTADMNPVDGRDHHNTVYTSLFAGGGVQGGRIIGRSNEVCDECIDTGWKHSNQIYMDNVVATVFSALGIDWRKVITNTPSGRDYVYVDTVALGGNTMLNDDEIAELFE